VTREPPTRRLTLDGFRGREGPWTDCELTDDGVREPEGRQWDRSLTDLGEGAASARGLTELIARTRP